jgi:hypothetical protein
LTCSRSFVIGDRALNCPFVQRKRRATRQQSVAVRNHSANALAAFSLLLPGAALAGGNDPLDDRVSVSLGTFLLETETRLRIDGATGRGTEFDAEGDLGLHDADRLRVDAYWRFANRHKLRVMYFDTHRSAQHTVDRDLQVGDTVFPLDANLEASLETRVGEIAYEYAFLRKKRFELSASLGVHNVRFDLGMAASQTSSGRTLEAEHSAAANGPLPVLGLHATWRLGERFYIEGQAQYFRLTFDEYDGRLEDYTASLVWSVFEHAGIGIGYNEFVTRLEVDAPRFDGDLRWRYGGMRIFVTASF